MATNTIPPALPVIALSGNQITVQLRTVPGTPTEVIWHIARNGLKEEKFSIEEMGQVLAVSQSLLGQARQRRLGDSAAFPKPNTPPASPYDSPGGPIARGPAHTI